MLGNGDPKKALIMRTSAQAYPRWTSDPITFKLKDLEEHVDEILNENEKRETHTHYRLNLEYKYVIV